MTTHSPATVAFAPPEAIFLLDKHPRVLAPCSREQAIQTLTSGYISVTEHSRFVLTEAKQDKILYAAIVSKVVRLGKLATLPNLVFVQASDDLGRIGGGREQVRSWGTKLPAAGLTSGFGLIDRDTDNLPTATVKVLARYSLENYLLDPLLIYAVLMSHGHHAKVLDAGIVNGNYFELCKNPNSLLQRMCVNRAPSTSSCGYARELFYRIHFGQKISAPNWLRDFRGHDLEGAVRETFRAVVGGSFIVTGDNCKELGDMLSERLPEFIPRDLLQVFEELIAA